MQTNQQEESARAKGQGQKELSSQRHGEAFPTLVIVPGNLHLTAMFVAKCQIRLHNLHTTYMYIYYYPLAYGGGGGGAC